MYIIIYNYISLHAHNTDSLLTMNRPSGPML